MSLFFLLFSSKLQAQRAFEESIIANHHVSESFFEENKGQFVDANQKLIPSVLFRLQSPNLDIYITDYGLSYIFKTIKQDENNPKPDLNRLTGFEKENCIVKWERVDMKIEGANISKENVLAGNVVSHERNYFYPHCPDGIYGVKSYQCLTIKNVYPGIDWVLRADKNNAIKYDFVVTTGSNPNQIKLEYLTQLPIELDNAGNLVIRTSIGELHEKAPVSFAGHEIVSSNYSIEYSRPLTENEATGFETTIRFDVHEYDWMNSSGDLIIDPFINWLTYIGGTNSESIHSLATDSLNAIFATGVTSSQDIPLVDPGNGAYFDFVNAFGGEYPFNTDGFIAKFNPDGSLFWTTFYGSAEWDQLVDIGIDSNNTIYVVGFTYSNSFPTYDAGGNSYYDEYIGDSGPNDLSDAVILKFNDSGVRLWATFYGGEGLDSGLDMVLDSEDNLLITGYCNSLEFEEINIYGTPSLASGQLWNAHFLKFDSQGALLIADYFGGDEYDNSHNISVDSFDNIYLTGLTESSNFPLLAPNNTMYYDSTIAGIKDAFLLKLSPTGALLSSTIIGGDGDDIGYSVMIDNSNNLYLIGTTTSTDFPVMNNSLGYFDSSLNSSDLFIAHFTDSLQMSWSTYLGGSSSETYGYLDDGVLDDCNRLYITFITKSSNLPSQNICDETYADSTYAGNGNWDGFITRFNTQGIIEWGTYIGSTTSDYPYAIALDNQDNLYAAGTFVDNGNGEFWQAIDGGGNTYFDNSYYGNSEIFLARYQMTEDTLLLSLTAEPNGCYGDATLNIVGGCEPYEIHWLPSGLSTPTATDLDPGIHTVTVSQYPDCRSQSISIEVLPEYPIPAITLSEELFACEFSSPVLSVQSSWEGFFQWSGPNDFESSFQNPVLENVSALNEGDYLINFTDSNGCSITDTVSLILYPVDIDIFTNNPVCDGGDLTLNSVEFANTTYNWSGPNEFESDNQNPTISNISSNNEGLYYVWVSYPGNCSSYDSIYIEVSDLPVISIDYTSPVCEGQDLMLTAEGNNISSFQWSGPTNFESSENMVSIQNIDQNQSGFYSVIVEGNNSCIIIDSVEVQVLGLPSTEITTTDQGLIALQENASYQWYNCQDMLPISEATFQEFIPESNGSYMLVISLQSCTDTSSCYILNNVEINNSMLLTEWNVYAGQQAGSLILETNNPAQFEVFDTSGRLIHSIKVDATKEIFRCRLSGGIYVIKEINSNQFKRVIID